MTKQAIPADLREQFPVAAGIADGTLVAVDAKDFDDAMQTITELRDHITDLQFKSGAAILALKAADALAHQLMHRDHGELLDRYWQARGGHGACTVCKPTTANAT